MSAREKLLNEIHAFLRSTGMKPTMFGSRLGNPHLVSRMDDGGDVHLDTAERIRKFMSEYEPPVKKKGARRKNDSEGTHQAA